MDLIAVLDAAERKVLFRETAARMGVSSSVITEKDFWVCWTLKRLFALQGLPPLLFKGGTSLSKAFGIIQRFSEDIDLSLNRAELGFGGEDDPLVITGANARRRKLKALVSACQSAVREQLYPALNAGIRSALGDDGWKLELVSLPDGQLDLQFSYPAALDAGDYGNLAYVPRTVRVEIGARSDHDPVVQARIRSYAADQFPGMFSAADCEVIALAPERTFWEKATILHSENHRPVRPGSPPHQWKHLSRHCSTSQ